MEIILIEYRAALVAILVTLIGVLGAFQVQRFIIYKNASTAFRSAFSDALSKLRNGREDPFAILERQFHAHEIAVIEFARHLGRLKRKGFMEAWHGYYCHDGNPSIPFLGQYSKHIGDIHLAKKNRALAIQRIEQLLAYAKHT